MIVDNAHPPLVRKMRIGSDWTRLRVAMRISTTVAANRVGVPFFYFGLMSGVDLMPWSGSGVHFFGVRSNTAGWVYRVMEANPYTAFGVNSSLVVGATETTASLGTQSNGTNQPLATINTAARSFFMVEITKGTPWTLKTWWSDGHSGSSAKRNVTPQDFINILQAPAPPGSYIIENTTANYTPNEVTNGALDSVFFGSLDAVGSFEVSDIAYVRLN